MFETSLEKEKALLVGVAHSQQSLEEVEENLTELGLLAKTAGASVCGQIVQKRNQPHAALYVGTGKAQEIVAQVELLLIL